MAAPPPMPAPAAIAFTLRDAQAADASAIAALTQAAFAQAEHRNGREQHIAAALHAAGALRLSLVAQAGSGTDTGADGHGELLGHIAASPVRIDTGRDGHTRLNGWLGLGPLAVRPDCQRRGLGQALVRAALQRLRAQGAAGCVVLGDAGYYRRFGFAPLPGLVLAGLPAAYAPFFQALPLADSAHPPQGVVRYHEAFDV